MIMFYLVDCKDVSIDVFCKGIGFLCLYIYINCQPL